MTGRVPVPSEIDDEGKRHSAERALAYMGLKGGEKITDIALDRIFIGSCTNARIEVHPGRLLYRECVDGYREVWRPYWGTSVVMPYMRCWWVRG